MLKDLPFCDINNCQLNDFFQTDSSKDLFCDRLSDLGLRDYLFKLSKQQYFKSLDSDYYSCEHFNQKFVKIKKKH